MEEQKIVSKEVKLNPEYSKDSTKGKKLTYDELNKVCAELSQQNQQMQVYIQKLHQQLHQMNDVIQSKRMDYLFKVVELANVSYEGNRFSFESDFVYKCVEEIQESLSVPVQEEAEKKQ